MQNKAKHSRARGKPLVYAMTITTNKKECAWKNRF